MKTTGRNAYSTDAECYVRVSGRAGAHNTRRKRRQAPARRGRSQVTTLQYAFAPACTAEELQTEPPGVLFSAPRLLFWKRGSMLGSPPAALFCSGPVSRNGLSLAYNDCLSPDSILVWSLFFLMLLTAGYALRYPIYWIAVLLLWSIRNPIRNAFAFAHPFRRFGCLLDLHFPSWDFFESQSGSQRSIQPATEKPALRNARFPFAPPVGRW